MKISAKKLAGITSLLEAVVYLIGFTVLFAVLSPIMEEAKTSQEQLASLLEYKTLYQVWILLIYVLFEGRLSGLNSQLRRLS